MSTTKRVVALLCLTTTALLSACDLARLTDVNALCADIGAGHCPHPDSGDPPTGREPPHP